jgi:hypothetical protein
MTDPDRISQRSSGLAAELLRAGAEEQPGGAGRERTLAALGISGAALTATTAANAAAAAGTAGAMGVTATKVVTAGVLAKWVGVGIVSGIVLSGAAAVVSGPAPSASAPVVALRAAPSVTATPSVEAPKPVVPEPTAPVALVGSAPEPPWVAPSAAPHVVAASPAPTEPALEVGAPLAAEVAFIDRARALLASGRAEQGLAELRRYEQEFPEARLLPEVLFLRMETCGRLGRDSEARTAASRLLEGFPRSPHAARARKLLGP